MRKRHLWQMLPFLFTAILGQACSEGANPGPESSGNVPVHFDVARSSVPLSDSLVLDLVGPDTVHAVLLGDSNTFSQKLAPGEWNFYAKFYANGILVEQGESQAKLSAGDEVSVSIAMHAVAGFLYVRIPLGIDNSAEIASGTLAVRAEGFSKSYPFEFGEMEASAVTEILRIGTEYSVQIHLFAKNGDTLFASDSKVTIDGENFAIDWQLTPLYAKIQLVVSSDSAKTLSAVAHLPSKLRTPKPGNLLVTEFMTEGKAEFVELYNATLDTLDLENCELLATSGSSLKVATDSSFAARIAPDSYLVLGTDSCENKDARAALSMPGTKGAIVFRCAGETIDSLFYASEKIADSLGVSGFPIDTRLSVQLPVAGYRNRSDGTFWCAGEFSKHAVASCKN